MSYHSNNDDIKPIKEGFIDLQVGITKSFKRRYVVVHLSGMVNCFEKADKTKDPKESFHLQGGEEIQNARVKHNRFRFKIVTNAHKKQQKFVFGCESQSLQQEWILVFKNVLRQINAIAKLQMRLGAVDASTMHGQLNIAKALADCGQLSKARRIFTKLISQHGHEFEEVHQEYETFLSSHCNDIHQAETNFIRRKKFFCLPKEFISTFLGKQFEKMSKRVQFLQKRKDELLKNSNNNNIYQIEYRNLENIWPNYLYQIDTNNLKKARNLVKKFLKNTNRINYHFEYSYSDIEQQAWYIITKCIENRSGAIRLQARLDAVADSDMQKKLISRKYGKQFSVRPTSPIILSPVMTPVSHVDNSNDISDNKDQIVKTQSSLSQADVPDNTMQQHNQSGSILGDDVMADIFGALDLLSDVSDVGDDDIDDNNKDKQKQKQIVKDNTDAFINNLDMDLDFDDDTDEDNYAQIDYNDKKKKNANHTQAQPTSKLNDDLADILDLKIDTNDNMNDNMNGNSYNCDGMSNIFDALSVILSNPVHHLYPWTAFMLIWTTRRDSMLHIGGIASHYGQLQCILEFVYLFTRGCMQELDQNWSYALLLCTLYNLATDLDHEDVKYKMCLSGVRVIGDLNVTFDHKFAVSKFIKIHKWLTIVKGQNKVLSMRKYFLKGVREELLRIHNKLNQFYNISIFNSNNKYYNKLAEITTANCIAHEITSQTHDKIQGKPTWGPRRENTYHLSQFTFVCSHRQISPIPKPIRNPGNFDEAYMLFCIELSKKLNPYFQQQIQIATKHLKCRHIDLPIKSENKCYDIMLNDLKQVSSPKAARIIDYCKCILTFKNIQHLILGFNAINDKFKICKIINLFLNKKISNLFNYKYLSVYILCKHPTVKFIRLICEVKLTIDKIQELQNEREEVKECFGEVLHESEIKSIMKEVSQNKIPLYRTKSPKSFYDI